jgi:hypothetical protein
VRVALADHLQVKVVGRSPAGKHRIQLLPGLLPGSEPVHRVGGDALGGVDSGGIAEAGGAADIVGGQPDCAVIAVVSHGQVAAFADVGDSPTVAVFDPVSGGKAESAVVAAGDDHIADTGLVSVC